MSEQRRCSICRRVVGLEDRFCSSCGTPLGVPATASLSAVSGVARPTLDELFAHLRSGEQRAATILMADLAGYSTLSEHADPEWVFHLLNEVFDELVECMIAYGAHIDNYVGDEIIALFGVPVAQERCVERAVRAALAARERLKVLNREGHFGGVNLGIHMGINVGPVMVGPIGHRAYSDYTVIGDAVTVAKRLEDAAPEGEIYVSQTVRDEVVEMFEFEEVGLLTLTGRKQPVQVFRLLGARSIAHPLIPAPSEAPFIGRENELRELIRHAETAASGMQVCVCLVGCPGIGKSHLIAIWRRTEIAQRFCTVAVISYPFGEHFPFLPIVDVVAQLAGLRLESWPPRVSGDIEAGISALPIKAIAQERLIDLLKCVESPPKGAEPDGREGLCDSLVELLETVTRQKPLCLILEDIQWMDEASRAIITNVFSEKSSQPLFLLLSAREHGVEWAEEALKPTVVRLSPLPPSIMERLVEAWAAPTLLSRNTIRAICDRAQGDPYFGRELAQTLKRCSTAAFADDASLPYTLQELFLAQLDALPIPLRRLVQSASVIGEPLSYPILEAAMGEESWFTPSLLTEAVRQHVLRAGSAPGQFTFERRLLFEAAYTTIPPSQRRELHARIATCLIDRLDTLGEVAIHSAAHHAYLGYRDERALDLLLRSARKYRAQYANRQAIQDACRALEVIGSLPQPEACVEQRLEALLFLSQSYEIVGDFEHAEGALAEAEVFAEECSNAELVAQITTSAATLRLMQGKWAEAEEGFRRASDAWEQVGNEPRVAHALLGMGLCARQAGDRQQALQLFSQAASRSGEALWVKAAALNNVGVLLLEEGRYEEAEQYLVEGLRANEQEADRRGIAHCKASVGELYLREGRFDEAEGWLRASVLEAESIDDAECVALASAFLARALVAQGHAEEALEALRQYESFAQSVNERYVQCVVRLAKLDARSATSDWKSALDEVASLEVCEGDEGNFAAGHLVNVEAETLCLGLEVALLHQQPSHSARLAVVLESMQSSIADEKLRQFAALLLRLEEEGKITPEEMQFLELRDFYSTRLKRLLARLASCFDAVKI